MDDLQEYVGELPNICGCEEEIHRVVTEGKTQRVFQKGGGIDFDALDSGCAIALHMHQPLIPADGPDLENAAIISNLQYMMEHQDEGDNHNAPVFLSCYKRMGDFLPQLIAEGKNPRVMLEYSGTLLHGLRRMGAHDVLDTLKRITCDRRFRHSVEWLGMPWGHPVAPSTPVTDYRLHVRAWQHHFAAVFGYQALQRVRGFSPSEMALPNHPEVAYAFVKTLKECGYTWVLVQEHTVELKKSGTGLEHKHIPHLLECTNSNGEKESIVAVIKTQGSDTKLIGQMQPYYEAKGLSRIKLGNKKIPPLVSQIADGGNGGVMMNEFPKKFFTVVREASNTQTPLLNISEYLEHLSATGVKESDFPVIQPVHQQRIWDHFQPGDGPEKLEKIIDEIKKQDTDFHMEGGSWTNDISWVRGYRELLGPMEDASARFYEKVIARGISSREERYRNVLFHLLCSQTSCYRYWGTGLWTEYGREICRRVQKILEHDF